MPSAAPPAVRRRFPAYFFRGVLAFSASIAILAGPGLTAGPAASAPAETDPSMRLTLDDLDVLTVGDTGPVTLSGTVTNMTDEVHEDVDIYPVLGAEPITSEEELAEQTSLPETAYIGNRILTEGNYDTIDRIKPQEAQEWSITLSRDELGAATVEGVHWLSAHAIVPDDSSDVAVAAGRVRTFLPYVEDARKVDTPRPGQGNDGAKTQLQSISYVLPLRGQVLRAPDGRIAKPGRWARSLEVDGRLGRVAAFGQDNASLTWLIDPAILDAIRDLAAGNPPRDLGPTDGSASDDGDADPSESPDPEESEESEPTELPTELPPLDPELDPKEAEQTEKAQLAATAWLDDLPAALAGHDVLALPYGDPDIPAIATHRPKLYDKARERGDIVLEDLDVDARPTVAPPSGFLDSKSLDVIDDNAMILLSDEAISGSAPIRASIDGHQVITTSSVASSGGPRPDRTAPVSVRQQAVSVAALRSSREPVVAMLPEQWEPPADNDGLLEPFAQETWTTLDTLSNATSGTPSKNLRPRRLVYPDHEAEAETDESLFPAIGRLLNTGRTLQRVLTHNDEVADDVVEEALLNTSYSTRESGLTNTLATQRDLDSTLDQIRIETPPGVMLSSQSGEFSATIINGLPETITVDVVASSDNGMEITVPDGSIEIPGESRNSVRLGAEASRDGLHPVTLNVVDERGVIVGIGDQVPIRTAQVSTVIWWFIGVGGAILFGAIAVRLVRRFRGRNRGSDDADSDDVPDDPTPTEPK